MAVRRHRAQRRRVAASGGVQIDAVEIIAGLLGGDGELGLVDQALEVAGRKRKAVRHLADRQIGKVGLRQRLQGEARTAGADRQAGAVSQRFQRHLGAFGKLAHDLIKHVCRHGRRAGRPDLGRNCLGHFQIEVSCLEGEL